MAIARSQSRTTAGSRCGRNDNDFSRRYPTIVKALTALPDETVMDGEVVALDETGKPSFNVLQNYGSSPSSIFYYAFDVLLLGGRDVMSEPLAARRALLEAASRRSCAIPSDIQSNLRLICVTLPPP